MAKISRNKMNYNIKNNTNQDFSSLMQLIEKFFPFAQKKMGFNKPVDLVLQSDVQNSTDPFGKTAHYEPGQNRIVVYTDGRHPKDIMRSLSHELIHHTQNCNGQFNEDRTTEEGYAQKDPHLREMEKDAFLRGNMVFRDWCDFQLNEIKGEKIMDNQQLKEVVRKAIRDAIKKANISENVKDLETDLEEGEKKPDGDGDGVPPWADKDDNDPKVQEETMELEGGEEELEDEKEDLEESPGNKRDPHAKPGRGRTDPSGKTPRGTMKEEEGEEEEPLKEWWDNSLYGKLLKEYTKR
tara:strand:- start:6300 stop:7184 length:885 start_codon:yes stop_codon:yes gene_type:complete